MDFSKLISGAEARLRSTEAARAAYSAEQTALIESLPDEHASLADVDQARFDTIRELKATATRQIDKLTAEIVDLRKERDDDERLTRAAETRTPAVEQRVAPVTVTREERVYTRETARNEGRSFFRDMFAGEYLQDHGARERVQRHMTEVRVEGEMNGRQQRADTTTSFAGLIPPQYLVDEYALVARAGRPIANTVRGEQLPESGMSLIIPRGTTAAATAIQATENSSVQSTDEVWANLTVPVVTIAGQQDISRQSLERGYNVDSIVYADLATAYAVNLDSQVISGSGSAGQMLGIIGTSGVNQATAFTAAATVATFYTKLAGQLNAVQTTRFLSPNVIYMHPRRWNWLVGQTDSSNRPLVIPNTNGPFNAVGIMAPPSDATAPPATTPVGYIQGLPVITDASLPTAQGTGPEDIVIVARRDDLILWENGGGAPFQLRFEQTLGNQLTVKLVAYNYAAFTAGRYATAVGLVGGNAGTAGFGLIAPVF